MSHTLGIRIVRGPDRLELAGTKEHFRKDRRILLLQRSSYSFPMGLPGIALLLLRTTVGLTMLIRDGACLPEAADRPVVYVAGALGILAGGLLLVGFLTTFAGIGGGMVAM